MAFVLQLSDNVTTINFLADPYFVMDGGFDISLPRVKRELVAQRQGFYVPLISEYEYRECKLKFQVQGTTRSNVLSALGAIERILRNIAARSRLTAGRRGELAYAWDGASAITYFEVYGGDIAFPKDALSVAKIHATKDGKYALSDVELTLYLSGMGYGVSFFSDTLVEIPLYNPSVGAKQLGGVKIQNPGYYLSGTWQPLHNYVQIAGIDLPGNQPLITRVQLASDTPYSSWVAMYMGLQVSPYPTKLVFDNSEFAYAAGGSDVVPADPSTASQGSYRSTTWAGGAFAGLYSSFAWSVQNASAGMHFAFLHQYDTTPPGFQFAIGIDDYVSYGIRYMEDWVVPASTSYRNVPLGVIHLPPAGKDLINYGTLNDDLWMGLWVAGEQGDTLTLDYLSLLPIANGMRIWKARVSALTGTMIDDGWRGLEYLKDASNFVATPFYGLLDPLKLEPGVDQRIYFTSMGSGSALSERTRAFMVRVYVVPTYLTLAL